MSNHTIRILTAVVGIPVILLLCLTGGVYFLGFVALASAVALKEFYGLAKAKGVQPLVFPGILFGFLINTTFFHAKLVSFLISISGGKEIMFPSQTQLLLILLLVGVAVMSLVELFRNKGSALLNLSATIFGMMYISMFFGTFIGIRELFIPLDFPMLRYFSSQSIIDQPVVDQVYRWGGFTVISILAVIWICDSAAFYSGTLMGKHKLFPRVSPNKSWEGAIFGFVFAIAASIAAKYLVLEYLPVSGAVVIGIIVGIAGQLGDLVESLFKRDAGVKDSSALIPGHGGVLDRFDSLLLVSPLVYLYLDFVLFS